MTITIFMLSFYWQIAWNSICLRENADKCMQAENRIVLPFVVMTEALTCMLSVCFLFCLILWKACGGHLSV